MPPEKKKPPSHAAPRKTPSESTRLAKIKDAVVIVQSVVTVIAILAAGIWFYIHREHLPKADISHEVTYRQLTKDLKWVHVSVSITNAGKRLLDIKSGVIRIQQILPLDPLIANKLETGQDPISPEDYVILWPVQRAHHLEKLLLNIEPGETDTMEYEFLVPAFVQTVKISTYYESHKPIGWIKNTIVDLKKKGE